MIKLLKGCGISMILCVLFLPAFSQTSVNHIVGSNNMISIPKWKVEKLLQSYFYTGTICDSTVQKQSKAIDTLNLALQASIKLDSVHVLQRDNKELEAETLRKQASNKEVIHKQELRSSKNKGRKQGAIVVAVLVALLMAL